MYEKNVEYIEEIEGNGPTINVFMKEKENWQVLSSGR
jgi:hypothetical protein